eukprot:CAMPEP_0196180956 /NCGR_PEP_ID=MMETSP0911-20130528/25630_1 /TAXON_ID=49265 /ORGANISM="Thalassiosira rotula, Strain GSO102" /LENGTH=41 /DNA_ID= /DNA_START= /DNA_END= /DNA_ORIENTATION=
MATDFSVGRVGGVGCGCGEGSTEGPGFIDGYCMVFGKHITV